MSLVGNLTIGHHKIGDWEAKRVCPTPIAGEFVYQCEVTIIDNSGYRKKRVFYVTHKFIDGALALAGKVMIESAEQMKQPEVGIQTAWLNFCDANNVNPYSTLD